MPRPNARSSRQADDGWSRSVRLFRSFRTEQSDPRGFYSLLADDAVGLMTRHMSLAGKRVADFGGGAGFYSWAFDRAGAWSMVIDASYDEMTAGGSPYPCSVVARAEQAPLADSSVDIAFSSNLLEHVPDLALVADQITRVVRPGGFIVLSYTIWWGPWGGHETSPWHYIGGRRAARRYERRVGRPPKNVFGESMFAASVRHGLAWVASRPDLELVEARPRYLPSSARWILRVPALREVLTWNLWLVLRKDPSAGGTAPHGAGATPP